MSLELIQNVISEYILRNVDMGVSQPSDPVSVQGITCYAIQFSWTGFSGDGSETITTTASNDGLVYTTVDSFIPTGTTGSRILNVEKAGYRFVKTLYTPGASSGTLTEHISGKVI